MDILFTGMKIEENHEPAVVFSFSFSHLLLSGYTFILPLTVQGITIGSLLTFNQIFPEHSIKEKRREGKVLRVLPSGRWVPAPIIMLQLEKKEQDRKAVD